MHIVLVYVHVKPECVDDFIAKTNINAQNSIKEKGIVRFDFLQQADDPTRFTLIEVYRQESDQALHRETQHYLDWRDAVAQMMAEPRQGVKHKNILPVDADW
jgi:(4S)-4-hydroxy-5-phosphonooxypentane-2,3-dione isomerase